MKRILSLAVAVVIPFVLSAQEAIDSHIDKEIFRTCSIIFLIGLFMVFILVTLKRILDYRLKHKILEKGIPENVALSILETNPNENKNINIKWFAILAGMSLGLTVVNYTRPLGIHSLAIMTSCIAVSFLGYYYFQRQSEK